jgi:hypothetical protein
MSTVIQFVLRNLRPFVGLALCAVSLCSVAPANAGTLDDLLARTGKQVSSFLEQFSEVKCTEHVTQEKLGKEGKVELKEDSSFDYLVILTNAGGEISLDESRLPLEQTKADNKKRAMLVSNGFATLFLIFHPYYSGGFEFTFLEDEVVDGHRYSKIAFQHVHGSRSPAALSLRGREYPLELSGTAIVDPQSGVLQAIEITVGTSMEDVGLKTLNSKVTFSPVPFRDSKDTYWFPTEAVVEVETPRQHWRNTHRFSDYKRFSVNTEEQVANK